MIHAYEVRLLMRKRGGTAAAREVVRVEHAHSPMDAGMQAVVNHSGESPDDEVVRMRHVGPMTAEVLAVNEDLAREIAERVKALL